MPVGGGLGSLSTAFERSRLVRVTCSGSARAPCTRTPSRRPHRPGGPDSAQRRGRSRRRRDPAGTRAARDPGSLAVALGVGSHNRNSTGRHHARSPNTAILTAKPTTTKQLPRRNAPPPAADESWCQTAPWTLRPERPNWNSDVKYMGGDPNQDLTNMLTIRHQALHRLMGEFLKDLRAQRPKHAGGTGKQRKACPCHVHTPRAARGDGSVLSWPRRALRGFGSGLLPSASGIVMIGYAVTADDNGSRMSMSASQRANAARHAVGPGTRAPIIVLRPPCPHPLPHRLVRTDLGFARVEETPLPSGPESSWPLWSGRSRISSSSRRGLSG